MAEAPEQKPSASTPVFTPFMQSFRNPSAFAGQPGEDPIKWLKAYDRVAKFNRWDDMMCLANVSFYLTGTAGLWFENNEDKLDSWEKFQTELKKVFGDAQRHIRRAQETLKTRAQRPGEDTQAYIQDVLQLCHRVDANMSEDDKVSHLMKGVSEDIYQALLMKEINNTNEFVKWVQHIESMRQKRVQKRQFERLPNVVPMSAIDSSQDLITIIRQIIREELQNLSTPVVPQPEQPQTETLESIIRDEIQQTLAPISRPATQAFTTPRHRRMYAEAARTFYPVAPSQPRKTDIWRTNDNQPICFHCGRPGHVLRYCRERKAVFDAYRTSRRTSQQPQAYPQYDDQPYATVTARSPSPRRPAARGRSPTRRARSPSPYRASSRSPSRRNEEN